jgi:3-oxoadipate enol-lactonase
MSLKKTDNPKMKYNHFGFVATDDLSTLYYEIIEPKDKPHKVTIVFLHGLAGNGTSWKSAAQVMADNGYRCVLTDLRGHGRSKTLPHMKNFSMDAYYDDLALILRKLNLKNFILVGLSSGGMIALGYAIHGKKKKYPLPKALVLVSSTYTCPSKHFIFPWAELKHVGVPALKVLAYPAKLLAVFPRRYVDYSTKEKFPGMFLLMYDLLGTRADSYIYHVLSILDFDASNDLVDVEMPTLLITGSKDWVIRPQASIEIAQKVKKAHLVHIGGMDHVGAFKKPLQITTEIKKFLTAHFSDYPSA